MDYDFTYTGAEIQAILDTAKKLKDSGYIFLGVATPSTNPGTPTQKVYYEAKQAGTYTNFGGVVLPDGMSLLIWNGSWTSETVMCGDGGVFDISVYKSSGGTLATFADLSAALNGGNNIPASARKGGMSVKFVQSSDNKYVQAHCTADEFTTDTTQWAIAEEGVYVENLEFVYVKTDAEGKILWAIKADGSIYYGAGVPQQVADYINERIAELSLDEYEDIVAFLNNLEKGDKTLQTLLNEKVDKEEGKSLIDVEYASSQSAIDNPEYLQVTTDNEDKILEGIKQDGTKVIGADFKVGGNTTIGGDTKILGNMEVSGVSYKVIENPEYLAAWVDAEYKIIFGFKADGKTYVGDADFLNDIENIKAFLANITDKNIDWDALSSITAVENPEFIEAKTDSEGKLLAGRTPDGVAFENVGFSAPKVSIDGHIIEDIEDPEGRSEITTDSEGKIISYRDSDGIKYEDVGVSTNKLILTDEGLTDLEKDLKAHGFSSGQGDWSDTKELHIAEPKCAIVNFTGILAMPTTKTDDYKAYMQFWDMNGNYFKKEVIMNAQGASSLAHPKKNIAIDICNNNGWDDDDTFKLQIGSWVPQDSFHLKGFYMDAFRGLCPVAYKWYDQIVKTRGELNDYVWKRAFIDFDLITSTSNGSSTAKGTEAQYNDGARCFPDGFPCIVYLNGEFYGIYSWQLKKHRDNYHMKKNNAKHVHLDGILNDATLWDNSINWEAFEIRNPKGLKTVDGGKYDGDNPTEITGDPNVDATTAEVKGYIEYFYTIKEKIVNAYALYNASSKTEEDKNTFKQVFETYLDSMNLIDYIIFSDVSNNYDGFNKNWQWFTYDGVKWYCGVYDTDGVFGGYFDLNDTIVPPLTNHLTIERQSVAAIGATWMINPIYSVYKDELESRYAELRDLKVIDANNIVNLMVNWLDRLGNKAMFEKEWKKWPDFIKNDSIHRMYKWVIESIDNMDSVYNYNQN